MDDLEAQLRNSLQAALSALKAAPAGQRTGEERNYGKAYQRLVNAGYAPQLRKRYRG